MDAYLCDFCGKIHDFYGTIILLEPDLLIAMSEDEKKKRVQVFDFLYLIDNSYYLSKGDLFIKVNDKDEFINVEVWVKFDKERFFEMTENMKGAYSFLEGKLFISIPNYKNSKGLKVNLIFDLKGKIELPEVVILDKESELGRDFIKGISFEKVMDWMKKIHHPLARPPLSATKKSDE